MTGHLMKQRICGPSGFGESTKRATMRINGIHLRFFFIVRKYFVGAHVRCFPSFIRLLSLNLKYKWLSITDTNARRGFMQEEHVDRSNWERMA